MRAVRGGQGGIFGDLTVNIEPEEARNAGAQWRVDGGVWRVSGYKLSGLAPGIRTLEFKAIDGWSRPSNQKVVVVENQTSKVSATYSTRASTTPMPWIQLLLSDD